MKFDLQRTIVALSTGAMPGRRAVVRLSGSLTRSILSRLFQCDADHRLLETQAPRAAEVTCAIQWPGGASPATVPALAYYWPDSRSFTGEPCAELHLIGSMPVVEALIAQIGSLGGEPAERGEFTLRSFLAGKLDLVQAEAVLGVIEAEGPAQLQAALSQLGGNISRPVRQLRDQLVELIAHLEAGLDFVEEDIEFITAEELIRQLTEISEQLAALADQLTKRDARSRTAQVVLVGLPNSGKSSLFNCLVGQDRAIVSPLAGTTRDVISKNMDLSGLGIELIDTAGMEELQGDSPRAAAQVALRSRLKEADIALFCIDSSQPRDADWEAVQMQLLGQIGVAVIAVGTKAEIQMPRTASENASLPFDVLVSVRTDAGMAPLRERMRALVAEHRTEFQSAAMQRIAVRCRQALNAARNTLLRAIALAETGEGEEWVASEMRMALDDLSAVIGEVHSDDILGEIFSRFCIGK
jgi:tRNA modification GTPase